LSYDRYASPGGPADHHEPRPQKTAVAKNTDVSISGHHTPPKNAFSQRMVWSNLLKIKEIGARSKRAAPESFQDEYRRLL